MTVREASLSLASLSLLVLDTDNNDGCDNENGDSEPGSPIFHNAIMFSNQIDLNSMVRERRGGIRHTLTMTAIEN